MGDRQIIKRAGQIGGNLCALQPQAASQQIGVAQGQQHARSLHRLVSQINHAPAAPVERAGNSGGAPFDHAVIQRERARQRHCIAQRPRRQRSLAQQRTQLAQHAVFPGMIGDLKGGNRGAISAHPPRDRHAAPARPAAVTDDPPVIPGGEACQSGQHPACRSAIVARQIKPVAIGFGVNQQGNPVLRAQPRIRIYQRAACADVHCGGQIGAFITRRGNPLGDHQILDPEAVYPDIEIRQQWRVGIAGKQFRQPRQPPAPCGQLADIKPAPQPVERPPIELHFGNRQKHALGIADRHAAQHRLAVNVAFDPPDGEPQARCRGGGRNLIGHKSLANRRAQEPAHQHQGRQ